MRESRLTKIAIGVEPSATVLMAACLAGQRGTGIAVLHVSREVAIAVEQLRECAVQMSRAMPAFARPDGVDMAMTEKERLVCVGVGDDAWAGSAEQPVVRDAAPVRVRAARSPSAAWEMHVVGDLASASAQSGVWPPTVSESLDAAMATAREAPLPAGSRAHRILISEAAFEALAKAAQGIELAEDPGEDGAAHIWATARRIIEVAGITPGPKTEASARALPEPYAEAPAVCLRWVPEIEFEKSGSLHGVEVEAIEFELDLSEVLSAANIEALATGQEFDPSWLPQDDSYASDALKDLDPYVAQAALRHAGPYRVEVLNADEIIEWFEAHAPTRASGPALG